MNCKQVQDLLVEFLLNELNEETKSAIDGHLRAGCQHCIAEEREIAEGMDHLLSIVPQTELSTEQRSAILARAISPSMHMQLRPKRTFTSNSRLDSAVLVRIVPYALAFAAGVLLMMSISQLIKGGTPPQVVDLGVHSNFQSGTFAVAPSIIPQDSEMSEEKYSKKLLVSMKRTNVRSKKEGCILWDALSNEVHFFGRGIEQPPPGMQYVFWLVGEQNRPLLAKELSLDPTGKCNVTAANPFGKIRFVFITLESKVGQIDRPSEIIELTLDAVRFNSNQL